MGTENLINMPESLKLTITCKKNCNGMKPTGNGFFCTLCNSEVIDFTHLNYEELKILKAEKRDVCGIYRVDQLDPDLVPIDFSLLHRLRNFACVTAAFFGLQLTPAVAQVKDSSRIENFPGGRKQNNDSCIEKEDPLQTTTDPAPAKSDVKTEVRAKRTLVIGNKTYYRSRRFPFIVRVKTYNKLNVVGFY
jgi:hypothetical protein